MQLQDCRHVARLTQSKTIVADRNLEPRRLVLDACCFVQSQKQAGGSSRAWRTARDYLLPAAATLFHDFRKKELGYEQGEGRNHTRLSKVKLSNVSLAEPLHVFINHKRNCGSKTLFYRPCLNRKPRRPEITSGCLEPYLRLQFTRRCNNPSRNVTNMSTRRAREQH